MELFLEKEKEKELSGYMRSTVSPSKKLIIINILNYTYTHGHYKNLSSTQENTNTKMKIQFPLLYKIVNMKFLRKEYLTSIFISLAIQKIFTTK